MVFVTDLHFPYWKEPSLETWNEIQGKHVTELTSLSQIDSVLSVAVSGLNAEKTVTSLMWFDPLMKTCSSYSVLFS